MLNKSEGRRMKSEQNVECRTLNFEKMPKESPCFRFRPKVSPYSQSNWTEPLFACHRRACPDGAMTYSNSDDLKTPPSLAFRCRREAAAAESKRGEMFGVVRD